jgi:phospholipid/cholesterol/gamma-HCH transport system permease protein
MAIGETSVFARIGYGTRMFLRSYGEVTVLGVRSAAALRRLPRYYRQFSRQYLWIGVNSIPLIFASSVFLGLVLGVQIGTQADPGTPPPLEAGLILRSVLIEMGPVVAGFVLAGRIGSAIAAEIGTMKVTEQVDALRTFGIDPVEYLAMPRILAATLAMPVLVVYTDVLAILSGFVSTHFTIDMTWSGFIQGMQNAFIITDVWTSLIKAVLMGALISLVGCYFGLATAHGARGVGRSTTRAVVWASVGVIAVDYIISAALYFVW